MKEQKYSITVFEDHAIIKGPIDVRLLSYLMKLMTYEGLTVMTSNEDGDGFKLIRKL